MQYDLSGDYGIGITNNGTRFLFDKEDFPKIEPHSWCVSGGYVHGYENGTTVRLHRKIMDCPKGYVVDHINHNKLDNRKCNLRVCTVGDNNANRSYMTNNSSGKLGVYWRADRNCWIAQIKNKGIVKHIGCFSDYNEAVGARKNAELQAFGAFAYKPQT